MTQFERGIIFLSYCYPERIIYDDACHLKKCCVNRVRKEVKAVSKRLGKMDMVVDKFDFRNHVDRWCKANCNPHDRNDLHGENVCLSVCPSAYRYTCRYRFPFFLFFFGGGRGENI